MQSVMQQGQQSDYRVEKSRTPVVLVTLSGGRVAGDVFLQPYVLHRHGPEQVVDLLNSAEPFFPLRCEDGAIRFYPKSQLLEVELLEAPEEDGLRRLGARETLVEITHTTGLSYTASISYEVPTARPRLLDYLNRLDQKFIPVQAGDGCRLVNWAHLHSIRPLD